jgi:mannose-6-phosphate isomerase
VERLRNAVRGYAWGSRSVIASLQGRPVPSAGPEAELWIGAHPADPSMVDRPEGAVSLADVIAAEPERTLGRAAAAQFGPRLPYLLKLLAAEEPLSLQAHPDPAQARAGYAAEQGRPGPRNYVDPYHKPELLVAVSTFEALCGFRDPKTSADLLSAARLDALDPVVSVLRIGGADGLRGAVQALLTWPEQRRAALVDEVVTAGIRLGAGHEFAGSFALAARLAAKYPGDVGVLVALLLNHVTLEPGEAVWMPAGNLHAYLRGTGVEIMAASDNVLRGGLTPKHVDVAELLRVLRFEVLNDPVVRAVPVAPGVVTWPTPVPEFALYLAVLDGETDRVELELPGPREVFCLRGAVRVDDGAGDVTLATGEAAFGPASEQPLICTGTGEVYLAGTARLTPA